MPAYSFQERFVPFVKSGSKKQTIRKRRAKGYAKKGDTLYLYYGLRTKFCKKLLEAKCKDAVTIIITEADIFLLRFRLGDEQVLELLDGFIPNKKSFSEHIAWLADPMDEKQKNTLAYNDGFRPEGTSVKKPQGSFDLMIRWWKQTHELPFIGDIIFW